MGHHAIKPRSHFDWTRKLCTLTAFLSACKSIEYDHPLLKIVYSGLRELLATLQHSISTLFPIRVKLSASYFGTIYANSRNLDFFYFHLLGFWQGLKIVTVNFLNCKGDSLEGFLVQCVEEL